MMHYNQEEWIYKKRPGTDFVKEDHYEYRKYEISPTLEDGDVFLEAIYISVDPYMRIQQAASSTWEEPHPLGEVQGAGTVLKVVLSKNSQWPIGSICSAYTGWRRYVHIKASEDLNSLQSLKEFESASIPYSYALSILGMPARTAYFGLLHAIDPIQSGNTVVISAAAGAVGSIVLQLAKIKGCKVVAITSSQEKRNFCKEIGADEVISYKEYETVSKMQAEIKRLCPEGIDVYWDNVGGYITDSIWDCMNVHSSVIICGQISTYNGGLDLPELAPRFLHHVLYKRIRIQGILARDYKNRMPEMIQEISVYLKNGLIKYKETITEGFENLPAALNSLFHSSNIGKAIVKL